MKLGPVTKLDKRKMATPKIFDDDAMSTDYDIIDIFQVNGQFRGIGKLHSGRMVCKIYIFINSNILSYKNWKQNWKISKTALILLLRVKVLFLTKNADFFPKSADISKI